MVKLFGGKYCVMLSEPIVSSGTPTPAFRLTPNSPFAKFMRPKPPEPSGPLELASDKLGPELPPR